jgi:hypothetical protein
MSCSVTNATSSPTVMPPDATAYAPPTRTIASVALGTRSKPAQVVPSSRALPTAVSWMSRAPPRNRSAM